MDVKAIFLFFLTFYYSKAFIRENSLKLIDTIARKYHCLNVNLVQEEKKMDFLYKFLSKAFFIRALTPKDQRNRKPDGCTLNVIWCDFELLKKINFASSKKEKWLFFTKEPLNLEDINITFDTALNIIKIKNESIEVYQVTGTQNRRLVSRSLQDFFHTERNFSGLIFKAGSSEFYPISHRTLSGEIDGYMVNALEVLATFLNFQFKFQWHNEGGGFQTKQGWTGQIGFLQKGELDIVLTNLNMNSERKDVIDLPGTLLQSRFQIYMHTKRSQSNFESLLQPLDKKVWFVIFAWLILMTIVQLIFAYLRRKFITRKWHPCLSISNNLHYVLQTFCQQALSWVPSEWSYRIIMFTVALTTAVIIPSYSGSLISSLTHRAPGQLFKNLNELSKTNYKLLVADGGSDASVFKKGDKVSENNVQLVTRNESHYEKWAYIKLIDRLCRYHEDIGILVDDSSARYTIQMNPRLHRCKLGKIEEKLPVIHQSIALKKGSPYTELFSTGVMRIRESGILSKLRKKHWPSFSEDQNDAEVVEVSMNDVLPIFKLLLWGIALSVIVWAGEKFLRDV